MGRHVKRHILQKINAVYSQNVRSIEPFGFIKFFVALHVPNTEPVVNSSKLCIQYVH